MVGCVIVKRGERISGGLHTRAGEAHAEVVALRKAGDRARGATLYVNLEPCAHHGRTPPCVEALLEAGVARVVVGMSDPDPRTAGQSIERLRGAGIQVQVGVEEDSARSLNRGFLSRLESGRPHTVLKLASSWDGRVATATGESRWITGPAAREWVHRLRAGVDAVVVGSRTAHADDPELTARRGDRVVRAPIRIVVDSKLSLLPTARMLTLGPAERCWVLATAAADPARKQALERAGARILCLPESPDGQVDLAAAWAELGRAGLNDVLVEGGGALAAALLRAGCIDELRLFLAPLLLGAEGRPVVGDLGVSLLSEAPKPRHWEVSRVGGDLLLTAEW